MSVQLPCSLRSFRTEIVRSLCGDRPSHGARAGLVQYHLRHVYGLLSHDFSKFLNFSLNQIVEAAEPVNPYENLTAASCLRREASRRPHGKGDTASVDPSQAKCELGITHKQHALLVLMNLTCYTVRPRKKETHKVNFSENCNDLSEKVYSVRKFNLSSFF